MPAPSDFSPRLSRFRANGASPSRLRPHWFAAGLVRARLGQKRVHRTGLDEATAAYGRKMLGGAALTYDRKIAATKVDALDGHPMSGIQLLSQVNVSNIGDGCAAPIGAHSVLSTMYVARDVIAPAVTQMQDALRALGIDCIPERAPQPADQHIPLFEIIDVDDGVSDFMSARDGSIDTLSALRHAATDQYGHLLPGKHPSTIVIERGNVRTLGAGDRSCSNHPPITPQMNDS